MSGLFENLPVFPPSLAADELRLLSHLPLWPTEQEVLDDDYAACRRLERRGLVKVSRQRMDPIATRPTWFAGKMPSATIKGASS